MPTDSAPPATSATFVKPGMAKAGKIVLILSLTVLVLPFLMFVCGLLGVMIWSQVADTSKAPPFLIEALPWSLFLVPMTTPVGFVGLIIGWLLRRLARKG